MTQLTREIADELMSEAENLNPGPWVQHVQVVAQAAQRIAAHYPGMDPEAAYLYGYLHDIGRREGVTDMRHTLDGYRYLAERGFEDAARICLTHSFPIKNVHAGASKWDCPQADIDFVAAYLERIEYTAYDRLIQLCDSLALPGGYVLLEKRLVDVALRYGTNPLTIEKWQAFFAIQRDFEQVIGRSIYMLLPGVVQNTFGFEQ